MPEDENEVEFCVLGTADSSPLVTTVGGMVFRGSLEVGDVLGRAMIADDVYSVSLQVEKISLHGTLVDELDTGSSRQRARER